MKAPVVTTRVSATCGEARRVLDTRRIRHLPVVEQGRLAGIVSDRDLRGAPPDLRIGDVMTRAVVTAAPETPVEEAALLLLSRKVGALPVVRKGDLVGIFTETDALGALVDLLRVRTGTRIEVAVGERPDALAQVTHALRELGPAMARLLSAVVAPGRSGDAGSSVLILRIETDRPGEVIAALRREGFELRSVPGSGRCEA